jgi:MFS family permease
MLRLDAATRRVLVSHALASVGMSVPWPLLLVLVAERTHGHPGSALLLGLAGSARMLPYVLLSWAAGRLADAGRRAVVVRLTLLARLVTLLVAGVALLVGELTVAVVACALTVAVATPAYPALAAAMPGLAGERNARATQLLVTVEVASFVVGPALGGQLLHPALRGWVLPLSIALVALAGVVFGGTSLPRQYPGRLVAQPARPFATLAGLRRVRTAVGLVAAVNLVIGFLAVALIPVAEELWSGGPASYGLAIGVLGFGALAGPLLGRSGAPARRVRWGMLLLGAPLLLVAGSPALVVALAPLALIGAAAVQVEAASTGILQDAVPDSLRATALGLADTAMVAAALLGALVGPLLLGVVGPQWLLLVVGVAFTAYGLLAGRRTAADDARQDRERARAVGHAHRQGLVGSSVAMPRDRP